MLMPNADRGRIGFIGIPTRNRHEALLRGVASFLDNAERHGRRPTIVVADQTDDTSAVARTRDALATMARQRRFEIRYADPASCRAYATALALESQVDERTVEFALFDPFEAGDTCGANRNALLLDLADAMFVLADDDAVCRVAAPRDKRDGIVFSSMHKPVQFTYLGDPKQSAQAADPVDCDILGLHERVLGRTLAECAAELSPVDTRTAAPSLRERIPGAHCRVRGSLIGFTGDTGSNNLHDFYAFPPRRAAAIVSRFGDGIGGRDRSGMRCAQVVTLGTGKYWPTVLTAYDGREPLPPWAPALRGQDFAYPAMLDACFPGDVRGFLPWVISHEPVTPRGYPSHDELLERATAVSGNSLLAMCAEAFQSPAGGTASERMIRLGRYLIDCARQSTASFAARIRDIVRGEREYFAGVIEETLAGVSDAPPAWYRLGRQYADRLRSDDPESFPVPVDLVAAGRGPEGAFRIAQAMIGAFGELLVAWPELLIAARALRERGHGLAQSLPA
jgi:hypothetical protein